MSAREVTNLAASVRAKLLTHSNEKGEDFQLILTRYAVERLLYRIAKSKHADQFVLKGAMLFAIWMDEPYRPTRDLDLLGYGDSSRERVKDIFMDVCQTKVEPDGLEFDVDSMRVNEIREGNACNGQRVRLRAKLGAARIPVQVDIGFGDASSGAREIDYPTILDSPAPRVKAYTPDMVVAEKLEAMVSLGIANSRMKDFYDILMLARRLSFQGFPLAGAIRETFERRKTVMPADTPIALSDEFSENKNKKVQWQAFIGRHGVDVTAGDLTDVIRELNVFLVPMICAVANGQAFTGSWNDGGPWK